MYYPPDSLPRIVRSIILVAVLLFAILPRADAQASRLDSTSSPLQDTLYLLDSVYIEIDIDLQELYLHSRSQGIDTFLCSTGKSGIPQGIATRTGIFSIVWKAERVISSSFKVPMLYWMPFDKGIGMHALESKGYYNYLGYEPSSHGCVRLSRESAESIFSYVSPGTLVYVHEGIPARVVHFGDRDMPGLKVMKRVDRKLLARRLRAVLEGRRDSESLRRKLALPAGGRYVNGIPVGKLGERKAGKE